VIPIMQMFHAKKLVWQRRDCTVWLITVLVRSEGTYEFTPLNGGSKRKKKRT